MPIEKPLPLMVGNKAYYSLTSYDPVEIEVDVPYTSEEDIQIGIEMTVADLGGTMADLDNPDWVAKHFDGLTTRQQVVSAMRQQVDGMNAQMAEEQKVGKCVEALSARLGQSIPPQHLEQARQAVQMRFTQQLQAEGITPDQFLARSGATMAQLDAMFDQQAHQMCEGDAALSAYAHEKKLKVDEHEYGRLLGLSPDDLKTVMEQARAAGQLDELREAALRSKAAQIVVAECSCTYNHETPEQARRRIAQFRQMQQMYDERFGGDEPKDDTDEQGKTGFKLV
jgi:hypothetical protein